MSKNIFGAAIAIKIYLLFFGICYIIRKEVKGLKKISFLLTALIPALMLCSCENSDKTISADTGGGSLSSAGISDNTESKEPFSDSIQTDITDKEETMRLKISDTEVSVQWEENESVRALKALCSEIPLTVQMSMYGGFEQVGSLGQSLPSNDSQTTTQAGDIVLYSSNQIVIFYGSNSWSYTRLGRITDKTADELKELLGKEDVTISIA